MVNLLDRIRLDVDSRCLCNEGYFLSWTALKLRLGSKHLLLSNAQDAMEKESKKRKREEEADPPRITFVTPTKTFERLFKGGSSVCLSWSPMLDELV